MRYLLTALLALLAIPAAAQYAPKIQSSEWTPAGLRVTVTVQGGCCEGHIRVCDDPNNPRLCRDECRENAVGRHGKCWAACPLSCAAELAVETIRPVTGPVQGERRVEVNDPVPDSLTRTVTLPAACLPCEVRAFVGSRWSRAPCPSGGPVC